MQGAPKNTSHPDCIQTISCEWIDKYEDEQHMLNESNSLTLKNYFLEPGFIFLAAKPTIISTVLGSCVAVCIYDRKRKVGGMNHFRLPFIDDKGKTTSLYGNVATLALIRMMLYELSKTKHLEAQLFGGAYNSKVSPKDFGHENVMAARKVLANKMIPIISEDVGGQMGRKIVFNTHTNEVGVIKVEKLRKKDWYPYEDDQ
jgi:chemotaxis protein CheD